MELVNICIELIKGTTIDPTFRVLAVIELNSTFGPSTKEAPIIVLAVREPGTNKSPFVLVK
jgi:hypothetical protein